MIVLIMSVVCFIAGNRLGRYQSKMNIVLDMSLSGEEYAKCWKALKEDK